jgi:hypothetical protein
MPNNRKAVSKSVGKNIVVIKEINMTGQGKSTSNQVEESSTNNKIIADLQNIKNQQTISVNHQMKTY